MTKIINKQDIAGWLKSLADGMDIIAPVAEEGVWRFRKVEDFSDFSTDIPTPAVRGLREHFTPETEVLFDYELSGQDAELRPTLPDSRPRLIFGARACDAAALRFVDMVYGEIEPKDEPYFARRNNTTLVGLFCNEPSWTCFCTEVGDFLSNPVEMDLFLTDLGEKYLAKALTPKGEELLIASQFTDASEADVQAAEKVKSETLAKLPERADHEARYSEYDWDSSIWGKLAQKCLGCGACAYLCPTCYCFDIQECAQGSKGSRYRCWDTCQFEKFTHMGHGHNPRPSEKERTRQRVFHKFKYSHERYGILACIGCGRCIASCPVNIDIRRVVNKLEEKTT